MADFAFAGLLDRLPREEPGSPASLMEHDDATRLQARLAEKEEAIRVLAAQLATKQAELDEIRRTRGHRLLTRYGEVKYRYLLPLLRWLRAWGASGAPAAGGGAPAPVLAAGPTGDGLARWLQAGRGAGAPCDAVCFSIADFGAGFVQRSRHLQDGLVRAGRRVLHVDPSLHQSGAAAELRCYGDDRAVVRLPGPRWLDPARSAVEGEALSTALAALAGVRELAQLEHALSWVELPFWAPLALAARERFGWPIVYDCMDEHAAFSTTGPAMLRCEEHLVAQADLVIASSRVLYDRLAPRARRALLLPNATDFEHWTKPAALDPLPAIPGPVIGYFGTIAEWLDVEMLLDAAARRPAWHFVLIGDVLGLDEEPLRARPNVHLLGRQPYVALPSFLTRFDVACIPFRSTPLTRAVDPVKFYEYLSAGKPVVATALPELLAHRALFYAVEAPSDFVPQIEAALGEAQAPERAALVRARLEFARRNAWSERYRVLEAALAELDGVPTEASRQSPET